MNTKSPSACIIVATVHGSNLDLFYRGRGLGYGLLRSDAKVYAHRAAAGWAATCAPRRWHSDTVRAVKVTTAR